MYVLDWDGPPGLGAPGQGPLAGHACMHRNGHFDPSRRVHTYKWSTPGVAMHSGFVSLTSAYVTPPPCSYVTGNAHACMAVSHHLGTGLPATHMGGWLACMPSMHA